MTEIYRVKSGESLSVIAQAALGDKNRWPELAHLNNISHPYFIYPGQVIELPSAENSEIVEVELPTMTIRGAPTKTADILTSPATVILLLVGVALFLSRR